MLWVLPVVFGISGLALALFPRTCLFWLELTSNRPISQVPASSLRWMGLLSILTAAILSVLILTDVIK